MDYVNVAVATDAGDVGDDDESALERHLVDFSLSS